MAKFEAFEQVFTPLVLEIGGNSYTIPPVAAIDGLKYEAAQRGDEDAEPFTDEKLRDMLLGDVYERMVSDRVPSEAIRRAQMAALANWKHGLEMAAIMWATGGDPKALEQYLTKLFPPSAGSTSTAEASRTRSPGSTSGTKPRAARSPRKSSQPTGD